MKGLCGNLANLPVKMRESGALPVSSCNRCDNDGGHIALCGVKNRPQSALCMVF